MKLCQRDGKLIKPQNANIIGKKKVIVGYRGIIGQLIKSPCCSIQFSYYKKCVTELKIISAFRLLSIEVI